MKLWLGLVNRMPPTGRLPRGAPPVWAAGLVALLVSCGGNSHSAASPTTSPSAPTPSSGSTYAPPNACPVDGCQVRIARAERAGQEIRLSFAANYNPDVSRNHVHVFWDTYTAKQVSVDAPTRFGVTAGDWEPTADNPFTTMGAVSVGKRGTSTRLCVSAGDRDHNVIDPNLVDCRDISSLLTQR
jgi:hypothetical protein